LAFIDGEAVKDSESFRRLLRRKLAEEKDAVFKVRRGEKTLEVPIRFKD
jgi:S1-C subfamily serine protease